MSYFHALIVLKNKEADELFEYDLSELEAITDIAAPFVSQTPFLFGGAIVQPNSADRLKIVKTEGTAEEIATNLVQQYRRNRVMIGINMAKEGIVKRAEESIDVTRQILQKAQSMQTGVGLRSLAANCETADGPKTVFIVHGHDLNLLKDLELVLRRWDIDPVVLSQKPNRGMTLVQKFETHAAVAFAFVLLTPDDCGGKENCELRPRARQNVIWEWGYMVGRLGRENVCCFYREGVELPSDLEGIVTINVNDGLDNKLEEIRKELKEAGFKIP